MKKIKLNRCLYLLGKLFALCCALIFSAIAQIDTLQLGVDELFSIAREKAFNKQHEDARMILRLILQRSPSYHDVRVLLGRTYAWDEKYDSARIELQQVLAEDPSSQEAFNALTDVFLWSGQYSDALATAELALKTYPSNEDFLIKKARALKNLGRDHEALNVLNTLEDVHPSAPGIAAIRQEIVTTTMANSIGVTYAIDAFTESTPLQYTYVQYSRRTPYGSAFVRLNYSYRFETRGTQLEFDFYPRIADGKYVYVNYGFSNSSLFPNHRLGGEFYCSLPASFEGSLGFRYLYFGPGSDVTIYTGTIGYYYRSYWFSLRPYLTPGSTSTSKSGSLTIRYFFGELEDYASFRMGAGFTPDERSIQSGVQSDRKEVFYLNSQTIGIGIQKAIGISYLLSVSFDFTNEEKSYDPGNYLTMYSLSMGIRWKF
jgi:YaiO family outer membrane protein